MRVASIKRVSLPIALTLCSVVIAGFLFHGADSESERQLARQQELSEQFVDGLREVASDHSHYVSRAALGPGMVEAIRAELARLDEDAARVEARLEALEAAGAGTAVTSPLERSLDAWKQLRAYERAALKPFPGGGLRAVLLSRRHETLRRNFVQTLSGATLAMRAGIDARIETHAQHVRFLPSDFAT